MVKSAPSSRHRRRQSCETAHGRIITIVLQQKSRHIPKIDHHAFPISSQRERERSLVIIHFPRQHDLSLIAGIGVSLRETHCGKEGGSIGIVDLRVDGPGDTDPTGSSHSLAVGVAVGTGNCIDLGYAGGENCAEENISKCALAIQRATERIDREVGGLCDRRRRESKG